MVIAHKIERFLHSIKSRLKNLWKLKQNVLIGQLHFGTFRSIPELIGICVLGSKCFSSFFYSSSFVSIRFTMRFIHRIVDILVSWCVNGTNNHCLATTICDQWGKNAACSVHKIVFYTLLPMGSSCIGSKNAITILCLGKPF